MAVLCGQRLRAWLCAGDNEIDDGMLHLLQQNIDGARAAGQEQAAEFMTKLQEAARKYKL